MDNTWTQTKPTIDGYYFYGEYRSLAGWRTRFVLVNGGDIYLLGTGDSAKVEFMDVWWCGPIDIQEPPPMPAQSYE